jgi:hypothetical protein
MPRVSEQKEIAAMQKQRVLWFTGILILFLVLVTACSSTGSSNLTSTISATPTVSPGEEVYILNGYATQNGGQTIVGFHPGNTATFPAITLPAGLVALDHRTIYTAVPHNGQTVITVTDTQTGKLVRSFTIAGSYSTSEANYTKAVLSGNGRWLALREQGLYSGESIFALVDTQAGKVFKTIRLTGDFDLDAVSPNGQRVYLLERLHDHVGHYYVRLYQVDQNLLVPTIIADKDEINDPRMIGSALTRQMPSDGTFVYTLYIDTPHNIAFVHILPLASQYYGARCIILPVGKSSHLLNYYTLALSADGSVLYAANGALGVVTSISVADDDVFSDHIMQTAHFDPGTRVVDNSAAATLHNGAVLSHDQQTLYFVGIRGIWGVNTFTLKVTGNYLPQQAFTSIALSANKDTLYAVHPVDGIMLVNVASGQSRQVQDSPAHTPWGIEWITD